MSACGDGPTLSGKLKGGIMLGKRTLRRATFGLAAVTALVITSTAPAGGTTTITISHQTRGCHMWQVGNGNPHPSLALTVKAGTVLRFVNNDVMPHKLMQTAGPKLRLTHANMNHMSAATTVKLSKAGVYRFTTKAGEDYPSMSMMKTVGEDYVLHLKVLVK
jgi:plastocyanin